MANTPAFWLFLHDSIRVSPIFLTFVQDMKNQVQINSLSSGLPRAVIEAAFIVMVMSAVCSYSPVYNWMFSHIPIVLGLVNTVGMVVMYFGILRGMKGLPHPLTVLWWIAIGMNLLDFVIFCLGETAYDLSAVTATALPLVYLPLGCLLMIWYRGRLGKVGQWMIIRILVVNLVPVLFYVTGLFEFSWGLIIMELITISADIWYAWVLRKVLVEP
jgi:hypothetical protein